MSEENDPLKGEVSVSFEVTEAGLSGSAKSRFLVAIDRLFGGAVDSLGAVVEGHANKIRTQSAIKQAVMKAEGAAAVQKLMQTPEFGDRVIDNFYRDQKRKQDNKDAVAVKAMEALNLAKPEDKIDHKGSIDEEWLNAFDRYVQDASSDHIRYMWGRILAGEIRRPGSFSRSSLRFLSEVDTSTAQLFQKIVANRSSDGFIVRRDLRNQDFLDYTLLEEIDLLHDVNGMVGFELKAQADGFMYHRSGKFLLKAKSSGNCRLPVIKITRTGREITTILESANDAVFLEDAVGAVEGKFDSAEIYEVIQIDTANEGKEGIKLYKKIK